MRENPLLHRDDLWLIEPLKSIHSFSQLLHYWQSPASPDLQPLRDLSFLWDIHFHSFHFSNLLCWSVILAVCYRILCLLFRRQQSLVLWALVLLWGMHPAFAMSTAWVAARKHLMAVIFILSASYALLRSQENKALFLSSILFLCSLLSQPLGLLWPLWAVLVVGIRRLNARCFHAFNFLLSALIAWANFHHYKTVYASMGKSAELLTSFRPVALAALGWGRFWSNITMPWLLAVDYSPHSIVNTGGIFIGILCLAELAFLAYCRRNIRAFLSWLLFFHLALILVLAKVASLFWIDSYLLLPGLALLVPLGFLVIEFSTRSQALPAIAIYGVVFAGFAFGTHEISDWYRSDIKLWETSYHKEETCQAAMAYAVELIYAHRMEEALEPGHEYLVQHCPPMPLSAPFVSLLAYEDKDLERGAQLTLLKNHGGALFDQLLYSLALARGAKDEQTLAIRELRDIRKRFPHFQEQLKDLEQSILADFIQNDCKSRRGLVEFCRLLIEK